MDDSAEITELEIQSFYLSGRDPPPVCSAGGHSEQFWHGQGSPLFDIAHHPAFRPQPTTVSSIPQCAVKGGFREAVVACDMPEPCSSTRDDSSNI